MAGNSSPDKPEVFRSPTMVIVWIVWLLFAVANWVDLAVQGRDHASAVAAAILLLATGAAYVTAQRPRIIADQTGVTVRNPLRDHRIGWGSVTKVDLADMLRVHTQGGSGETGPSQGGSGETGPSQGGSGETGPSQGGSGGMGPSQGGSGGTGPPRRRRRRRRSGGLRGVAPPGQHNKVITAWAIHYSRRRKLAAEGRARRPARSPGLRRSSLGLESGGRGLSFGAPVSAPEASAAEAEAEKIARMLSERATAARAEAVWASGTTEAAGAETATRTGTASPAGRTTALDAVHPPGGSEPLTSTWSGRAIAALVIPALILLVVWLF